MPHPIFIYVQAFLILTFSGTVHAQALHYAGYEAKFWMDVDDPLRRYSVKRVCVLPFDAEINEPSNTYRRQIEDGFLRLSDGRYHVVTRDAQTIRRILQNMDAENSDLFDAKNATRIGRFLGAEGVITGLLWETAPGERRLHLRLIHLESAQILVSEHLYITSINGKQYLFPDWWEAKSREWEKENIYFWRDLRERLTWTEMERICILPPKARIHSAFHRRFEAGLVKTVQRRQVLARAPADFARILTQLNRQMSDYYVPNTAARIGGMLDSQVVVLIEPHSTGGVNIQAVETETARILFSATGQLNPKTGEILWQQKR